MGTYFRTMLNIYIQRTYYVTLVINIKNFMYDIVIIMKIFIVTVSMCDFIKWSNIYAQYIHGLMSIEVSLHVVF